MRQTTQYNDDVQTCIRSLGVLSVQEFPFKRRVSMFESVAKRIYVDIYVPFIGLAIEIDGRDHLKYLKQDRERDSFLNSIGVHVLRIKNEQIAETENPEEMIKGILIYFGYPEARII